MCVQKQYGWMLLNKSTVWMEMEFDICDFSRFYSLHSCRKSNHTYLEVMVHPLFTDFALDCKNACSNYHTLRV